MLKFNEAATIKRSILGLRSLAPATRQGQLIAKAGGIVTGLACVFHLVLGASPIVVLVAGLTVILSIYPIALYGFLNIGAVLVALVGFRYVGFPLVAKLAMGQALDTFLISPIGSFGVVLLGVSGYLGALFCASNRSVGRPLLQPIYSSTVLGRVSFLAAAIGVAANMTLAFRIDEQYSGITIAEFFVPFLHLAFVSGIARAMQVSKMRRSVDAWVIMVLIAEIAFAIVQNSRMALMETPLCFVMTVSAFEYKIRWRQFGLVVISIGMMVVFITPVFLQVRSIRGDLSWTGRIEATIEAATNWSGAFSDYMRYRDTIDRLGWYLNYYGSPRNVFERMSLINHVDVLKSGSDKYGKVGLEDLRLSLKRAMPRMLEPDKPRDYSQGAWLYKAIGVQYVLGGFATAPLIGTGYAAFSWIGAFLYPLVLGFIWLLLVKKFSGWDLKGNIWTIYLLIRVHNQFIEGSSDAYLVHILRSLPQDLVLLWIINILAKGRFLYPWRRTTEHIYGK